MRYKSFLHVADQKKKKSEPENKGNKYLKVKPLLETVRANCKMIEPEANHLFNAQVIPSKTKRMVGFVSRAQNSLINACRTVQNYL